MKPTVLIDTIGIDPSIHRWLFPAISAAYHSSNSSVYSLIPLWLRCATGYV
jgi:hypothetical protein